MDAIITFEERRFSGRTEHSLYPTAIEAEGREYGAREYVQKCPLNQLDANYDTVKTREKGFSIAIWILAGVIGVFSANGTGIISLEDSQLFAIAVTLTMVSALLVLGNFRKRTYAVFNTTSGMARISISDDGTQRDAFDAFLQALQQQIRIAHNQDIDQGADPNHDEA